MLVLGRKKGETILIGDNIKITLVKGDNVRIGIEAPPDIPVSRGEKEEIEENSGEV